jgi:hypothetical protein
MRLSDSSATGSKSTSPRSKRQGSKGRAGRAALLDSLSWPDDQPALASQLEREVFLVLPVAALPRLHVNAKPIHDTSMNVCMDGLRREGHPRQAGLRALGPQLGPEREREAVA